VITDDRRQDKEPASRSRPQGRPARAGGCKSFGRSPARRAQAPDKSGRASCCGRRDSIESQIKQLQARTDAALNLIEEVLAEERRQRRLDELQAQLASIADPLEEAQKHLDKTAFILVYQADRMYRELNQTDSAVEAYNRVIELFPQNRWATVARQRLSEIENRKI
jgi:TolA-binding protein